MFRVSLFRRPSVGRIPISSSHDPFGEKVTIDVNSLKMGFGVI